MILWGDKYDVALVNRLVAAVARHASRLPRFVLLSDRPRPCLDPRANLRPIPDYWMDPLLKTGGCQAKLCMFETGVLQPDLPAVFLDLDTAVFGDLSRAPGFLTRPGGLMLLQSAIIPLGLIGRALWRLSDKWRYARGNSSMVIFHPAHCAYIAAHFRDLRKVHPDFSFKPMRADERFMSWAAQSVVEAVPDSFAVKLPTEFMSRFVVFSYLWAVLPWVRRRRAGLVVVTLPGDEVKPEALLALPEGGRVTDRKGRTLIWSDRVMGGMRRAIVEFYAE